jgi:hypothetical protein
MGGSLNIFEQRADILFTIVDLLCEQIVKDACDGWAAQIGFFRFAGGARLL